MAASAPGGQKAPKRKQSRWRRVTVRRAALRRFWHAVPLILYEEDRLAVAFYEDWDH